MLQRKRKSDHPKYENHTPHLNQCCRRKKFKKNVSGQRFGVRSIFDKYVDTDITFDDVLLF